MMDATGRIADGNFDIQLPVSRSDEIGQLSGSINRMASRLETLVKGQKHFLGDVAHELLSPLGRMRVTSEILERNVTTSQTKYLAGMQDEIALMSELTQQLIALAKSELRPDVLELVPVKIAEVVERAIRVE